MVGEIFSGNPKKGRQNRNSDGRRGRSYTSFMVRDVGCEEQEKIWTDVSQDEKKKKKKLTLIKFNNFYSGFVVFY